jgi:hypothetical protein
MIEKMIDKEYFELKALSVSFLKGFERSPAHAFTRTDPTDSMSFGSLVHYFILQPEIFTDLYIVSDLDGRTKEGKQLREDNPDKQIIKSDVLKDLITIRDNLNRMKFNGRPMSEIIDIASKEYAVTWDYDGYDLACKGKMDMYYNDIGKNYIFDLKTCQDARPESFKWDIKKYGYDLQAGWYLDGVQANTDNPAEFIFIAIETKAPFGIQFHKLSTDMLNSARVRNHLIVDKYRDWLLFGGDRNICYSNEINIIGGSYES